MDVNDFFREATLRLCGNLNLDIALKSSLEYFEKKLPVSHLLVDLYFSDMGILENIVSVSRDSKQIICPITPLSKDAISHINGGASSIQEVLIINRPEQHPVAKSLFCLNETSEMSLLVMRLPIKSVGQCAVVLIANGHDQYTSEHAHLLSLLRDPFNVAISNALKHREVVRMKAVLDSENRELLNLSRYKLIGENIGLRRVMEMVQQVAPLNSPVLLLGETGVGKEVIANAIHDSSPRKDGPFIKVNCGAIPETLIDSELFGYEKGAFTGATALKRGFFERADKGTIFLDEIGELPLHAQIRLLRVLQNREIERVGGNGPVPIDVRIISATHRNLEEMIEAGAFREDLWFRLNIFPVMIPPLRQRKDDIPILVHHLLEKKSRELKLSTPPPITLDIIEQLKGYHWPGNVRELENLIERALILNRGSKNGGPLTFDIPSSIGELKKSRAVSSDNFLKIDEAMAIHIQKALNLTKGKISGADGAAQLLGINSNTLRSRMRKLKIHYCKVISL